MNSALLTSFKPEITAEDWQRTPPSVQQVILHLLERVVALEQEVSTLRAVNEQLREQTQRSSHNSSQPPSSDTPRVPLGSHARRAAESVALSPVTKDINGPSLQSKRVGA